MASFQDRVQALLDKQVAENQDRGVQVAIYQNGKLVVDAWAGVADVRDGKLVDGDTLFPVFSTTKGIAATLVHLLAERGKIDYDAPIARYWPEFAAQGKEGVTVRHALNHTSGVPQLPEDISLATLCDWDAMCRVMEQTVPLWPAGQHQHYHAVTYGWLLGEVLRRVDGRDFNTMVREEINEPLGMSDFYVGLPDELGPRVAWLEHVPKEDPNAKPPPADEPVSVPPSMMPLHSWMNEPEGRRACFPASNGIASARATARHYAALLPGGVDGVELLPPSRVQLACEPHLGTDQKEVDPATLASCRALGYSVQKLGEGSRLTAFGHGGFGGSHAFADPAYGVAVCIVRNSFTQGDPVAVAMGELRRELGLAEISKS